MPKRRLAGIEHRHRPRLRLDFFLHYREWYLTHKYAVNARPFHAPHLLQHHIVVRIEIPRV